MRRKVLIQISEVSRRFGSQLALDQVSLTIPDGAITGLVGPNGAGKTTLLRIIAGLDQADQGKIIIDGTPMLRGQDRPSLAALLDPNWVHRRRTARDHLRVLALIQNLPAKRVDEVLELTGIAKVANRRVGQFSLGMRQRLGIATVLLANPRNLIFDEPINGLDPEGVLWMRNLAKELASLGCAIVISSHLLSEMSQLADRIVVIGNGRIISESSLDELTSRPESASLVGATDLTALATACAHAGASVQQATDELLRVALAPAELGRLALEHDLILTHLEHEKVTLEEMFQELTENQLKYRGKPYTKHQPQHSYRPLHENQPGTGGVK